MTRRSMLWIACWGIGFLLLSSVFSAAEPLRVMVSIPPQTYFVSRIGGEAVTVQSMLPEGGFPHTFEPTPKQMKQLSKADVYVRIGVEFEEAWWSRIRAANQEMHVVDSTVGIEFLTGDHHHHDSDEADHEDDEHKRDPHIWLSPRLVKRQADAICQGLVAADPVNEDTYRTNNATFQQELDRLDQDIQQRLASLSTRNFMIFHPSWAYFARDYQLKQIPIEIEGKEPSASEMIHLMKFAQKEQIGVIFVQPQTSRRSVETIARQLGADVELLDPLAANWLENMRSVASRLAETLGGK